MRVILCFLFCFSFLAIEAAETTIQGQIKGFDNKQIRISIIEDYITDSKKELAQTKVINGAFRVTLNLEETRQLYLRIEDKESSFFAEAGEVYNLQLSYDEEKNEKSAFIKVLDLKMAFPKANELNQLIKQFNQEYQEFFAEHYQQFVIKAAGEEIEEFIAKQKAKEAYHKPEFMAQYAEYALANLEDINRAPKQKLFEAYLKDKVVLQHHKEYMNFFKQFYQADFEQYCLTKKGSEFLKAVMIDQDLKKSLDILETDKAFPRRELTELYFLNGLFEVFHKKTIEQASVIQMLEEMKTQASTLENQKAAGFISSRLMLFGKDVMAPSFELLNEKDEIISLESLKGKPVYLGFWASWSIPSLRQLSIMKKLHEDYGDKIHIVSINLDEDPEKMKQSMSSRQLNWTFLHYANDFDIREKYEVRTVPSYYLIDSQGKMLQTFAPSPSEIDRTLFNMSR